MASAHKREFSGFTLAEALVQAGIEDVLPWQIRAPQRPPSAFYQERLQRIETVFDTTLSEQAKQLLIEVVFEEAAFAFSRLKIFKEAPLRGATAGGFVDYLITLRRAVPGIPLLCVAEAKKDNFEKGMAQCLVEMAVCAELNAAAGKSLDLYGIVTNGTAWQFYRREVAGAVWQSGVYSLIPPDLLLGVMDFILARCEENAQ